MTENLDTSPCVVLGSWKRDQRRGYRPSEGKIFLGEGLWQAENIIGESLPSSPSDGIHLESWLWCAVPAGRGARVARVEGPSPDGAGMLRNADRRLARVGTP